MDIKIDNHKLIYHPGRVADFLRDEIVYPIYTEISLTNRCNFKCKFCALEYRQRHKIDIDFCRLMDLMDEFKELNIKSICFAGEGEPLLYKKFSEVLDKCKQNNIDTAIETNGSLLTQELSENFCRNMTWIKISTNAIREKTYSEIHRTDGKNLKRLLKNISELVQLRNSTGSKLTIGLQALLLPDNADEMIEFAEVSKSLGVDYFVIKPFNFNMNSNNTEYKSIDYNKYLHLADDLMKFNCSSFNVYFRVNAIKKVIDNKFAFQSCYGINFFALIYADGNAYTCSPHSGIEDFCYGNIYESSFKELWNSDKRKKIVNRLKSDLTGCMIGCRLDEINRYLYDLKNSVPHVNFI